MKLSRQRNVVRHSQFSGTFTRLTMDGSKAVCLGNPSSASQILLKPHKAQKGPNLMELIREDIEKEHHAIQNSDIVVSFRLLSLLLLSISQSKQINQLFVRVPWEILGSFNDMFELVHGKQITCDRVSRTRGIRIVMLCPLLCSMCLISVAYVSTCDCKIALDCCNSRPNMEKDNSQAFSDEYADNTSFKGGICGPIAASMNESMFLLVISRWKNAFEGLKVTHDHKFLSAAGALMRIMIRMLDLVLKLLPGDSKEPLTARILLYKLFYDQTDQGMTQFLLSLIKSFDTHKQTKSDLSDLVEMIHVLVRLMENLQTRGTLRIEMVLVCNADLQKIKILDLAVAISAFCNVEAAIEDPTALSNSEQSTVLQKKSPKIATSGDQENMNVDVLEKPEISVPVMENLGSNMQMENKKIDIDDLSCSSDDSSGDEQPAEIMKFYKNNSVSTNHYIVCMLQRITDDLDLSPMLYQAGEMLQQTKILGHHRGRDGLLEGIADALGEDEADVVIPHEPGYQNGGDAPEHESVSVPRRKRRFVLTERDGDENKRSILMVKFPRAQVINKLKQLGLKVALKKRKRSVGRPFSTTNPDQLGENGEIIEKEAIFTIQLIRRKFAKALSDVLPFNRSTRKRVRAFNKDQEEMIKAYLSSTAFVPLAVGIPFNIVFVTCAKPCSILGICSTLAFGCGLLKFGILRNRLKFIYFNCRSKNKDDGGLFGDELPSQVIEGASSDSDDELLCSILK
ncbi:hypothetical protein POTOM_061679 [Populus tomentosa]|uniref:Uncharacterized protein n=1 Tax=Populus tomentosa TaxID=118781 RepID=A0A8X7XM61_POPTO|nr:hypothetical protein POTOM_061679 [Populus tomentosa]